MVCSIISRAKSATAGDREPRYAYIAIFVLVIIVSPSSDVPSQFLMTLPVWGLFEIGLLLVRFAENRRMRQQQAETSET